MDYGKRSYGSPANNQPTYIQEITDQYIHSIGGLWPADFKRPYVYASYTEMQYLFNSPVIYTGGEAPTLEDLGIVPDPLIPIPRDPYDPYIIPPWPTPPDPKPPDDEPENPPGCSCASARIGYTTTQMSVGESQTLYALGNQYCNYTWKITGGGTFSPYFPNPKEMRGSTVNYVAPADNPNCADNATITLYCGGREVDSLRIAVNKFTESIAALKENGVCQSECTTQWVGYWLCGFEYFYYQTYYKCDGSIYSGPTRKSIVQSSVGCQYADCDKLKSYCDSNAACVAAGGCCKTYTPGITDLRTPQQKAEGCCPSQL